MFLPAWDGRYYWNYPIYQPDPRLGGPEGFRSLVDFVPGVAPYEQLTTVDIEPDGDGARVTMEMEAMHDDEWTQRLAAGRATELDNLAKEIARRR